MTRLILFASMLSLAGGFVACTHLDIEDIFGFPCRSDDLCTKGLKCVRPCPTCKAQCLPPTSADAGPTEPSSPDAQAGEPATPPAAYVLQKPCKEPNLGCLKRLMSCSDSCFLSALSPPDAKGDLYVGGMFAAQLQVDISKSYKSTGYSDAFIAKVSGGQKVEWVRHFGGDVDTTSLNQVKKILLDEQGDLYVLSEFQGGDLHLDSRLHQGKGSFGILLAKFSSKGELQWHQIFDGASHDRAADMVWGPAGHLYLLGGFTGRITVGSSTLVAHDARDQNIFLAKFDRKGAFKWALNIGGQSPDHGASMAWSKDRLWVLGKGFNSLPYHVGSKIFTPRTSTPTRYMLAQLKASGEVVSSHLSNGPGTILRGTLRANSKGELFLAGGLKGQSELFGQTCGPRDTDDSQLFVARIDSRGKALWCNSSEAGQQLFTYDLHADDQGAILTGSFRAQIKFSQELELISKGNSDFFAARIDAKGEWRWVIHGGGPVNDSLYQGLQGKDKQMLMVGKASGKLVLGNQETPLSNNTLFLWRFPLP